MSSRAAPLAALAVAVALWGTTFVVSDTALRSMSPAALTVARFAVALCVLGPAAAARGGFLAALRSMRVALLGATGVAAYYGLQNLGLVTAGAGTAAVLQAVLPVATALIAWAWLRERPTPGALAGLALATLGVTLVAGQVATAAGSGAALILVGVLAYAVYTVLLRRQAARDPVVLAAASCSWGLVFLLPWLADEVVLGDARFAVTLHAAGVLLYLGVAASALTLLLWTYGARMVPSATAGAFTAAIPAVGYLFAVLTGEPPTWGKAVGAGLALVGAAIAARAVPGDAPLRGSRRRQSPVRAPTPGPADFSS